MSNERDPKWPFESAHWSKLAEKAEAAAYERAEKTNPEFYHTEDFKFGVEMGVQMVIEGIRIAQEQVVDQFKAALAKGNDDLLRKLGLK